MGLLAKLHQAGDTTIVAVTHDEAISGAGGRVLALADGQLHENGETT